MKKTLTVVNTGINEIKEGSDKAFETALKQVNTSQTVASANTLYLKSLINLHMKTYILSNMVNPVGTPVGTPPKTAR